MAVLCAWRVVGRTVWLGCRVNEWKITEMALQRGCGQSAKECAQLALQIYGLQLGSIIQ